MIVHVALFTPRSDLTADERAAVAAALVEALSSIESIRTYRVGRRVRTGTAYDALGAFEYLVAVEFEDLTGLQAYLNHPAHARLGQLFYTTSSQGFAGDFEVVDREPAAALARWNSASDFIQST